jgi:hypothetical protein
MEHAQTYVEIAFQVIGVASAIAAIVPIPQAVGPLIIARKLLDIFALNMGYSKNARR